MNICEYIYILVTDVYLEECFCVTGQLVGRGVCVCVYVCVCVCESEYVRLRECM